MILPRDWLTSVIGKTDFLHAPDPSTPLNNYSFWRVSISDDFVAETVFENSIEKVYKLIKNLSLISRLLLRRPSDLRQLKQNKITGSENRERFSLAERKNRKKPRWGGRAAMEEACRGAREPIAIGGIGTSGETAAIWKARSLNGAVGCEGNMYRSCGTRLRSQCLPIYGPGTCVPVSGSSPSGPACLFRLSGSCIPYSMRLSVHVHGAHLSAPRETRARARTVSIKYRQSPLLATYSCRE